MRYDGKEALNESVVKTKICTRCKLEKQKTEFSKDRSRKDGRYIWCKDCKYEHNQGTKYSRNMKQAEYNSQHSIELELKRLARRQQRIDFIWKLKSDPCKDCGKTFHPFSMDFDHRDPTQKSRDISQINRMDEIIEEVKKCDLVCANCHRIRTFTVIEKKYIERKSFLELKLLTAQPAKV